MTKWYIVPVLSHQTIDSTSRHYDHHCKPKYEIQNYISNLKKWTVNWSTTYPLENSSSAVVQPTQLTRSLSVLELVKELRKKIYRQLSMMAIDLQVSDMRDESLQSKHLRFICGFEATLCVLIFAEIGHFSAIHINSWNISRIYGFFGSTMREDLHC